MLTTSWQSQSRLILDPKKIYSVLSDYTEDCSTNFLSIWCSYQVDSGKDVALSPVVFLYLSIVSAETVSSDICLCNIGRFFCRDRERLSPINLIPRHIAVKLDKLGLKWMSCRRLVYGRWDMARTSCNYWAHDCLFFVFWKAITLKRRICYVGSDWGKTLTNLFDELHRLAMHQAGNALMEPIV